MSATPPFSADLLDQNNYPDAAPEPYNPLEDRVYITGLLLLLVSVAFFFSPFSTPGLQQNGFGSFMIQYLLVWLFMIVLWVNGRLRWWMFGARRKDFPVMLLLLLLWLVSCFSLNREIDIFQESVPWLNWYIGLSAAACIAYGWQEKMPPAARWLLLFVLGATSVLFTYYAIALAPVAAMGLVVFWFFGLTLHALIPLVFTIYILLILRNAIRADATLRLPVFAGIALPLLVTLLFTGAWYRISSQLAWQANQYSYESAELPKWVLLSQHLEQNWLYGHLLKSVAEGNMPARNNGFFEASWLTTFGVAENDPLLQIAAAVSPHPELNLEECQKIYAAQYNSRQVMEERFWSGNDLLTTDVKSRVLLDPGHRLSYTEKILTVAQQVIGNSGRTRTQEAIYTFYLPEGGAVTSLALWIDGVEQPGVLTTRSKAKAAYTAIVGVERRDPAVVFWQEGNQVRVRVFPVTPELPRQFKVGITAPLRYDNQTLSYQNVAFDGPSALSATERDSVYFEGNGVVVDAPATFKSSGQTLTYEGRYQHRWTVVCQAPALARSSFSFQGKNYSVLPWNTQSEAFRPTRMYVDLNAAWTQEELSEVRKLAKEHAVFAATSGALEQITEQNAAHVFQQSRSLRFSLFPFYKIDMPESSLLITKSAAATPLPSELKGSRLEAGLQQWEGRAMRVFHLGDGDAMTAYLRALREKRTIFCVSGSLETLKKYVSAANFPQNPENPRTVALPESGVLIVEKDTTLNGKAPDHLFRLFAYNSILRELAGREQEEPTELVELAEQAYVVTPVSSLVTLESKADYERFDIKATEGLPSLGNAGAVPEPHEWALIILLTFGAFWAYRLKL